MSYRIVISLCVGSSALVTLVPLSILNIWKQMGECMLFQVAFLGEPLVAYHADVRFYLLVHVRVVQQIPSTSEVLATTYVGALV